MADWSATRPRATHDLRPGRPRLRAENSLWLRLPSLALALVVLIPAAYLAVRAAAAGPAAWGYLRQPELYATLGRTLGLAATVTLAATAIAVPVAWLTVRTDLPARRAWAVLAALPLVIPSYVGAYLFVAFLGPYGMLADWLGRPLPALYGFPGAALVLTLLCYPYVLLTTRAALQKMDPALEEAARSLGHGPWETFRRVTLPHLRPALAAGGLLTALYVLRDFGAVSILRYNTFTRVIYLQYASSFDRSTAAVLALILVAATFVILALEQRLRGRGRYTPPNNGSARPATTVKLGRWRWPVTLGLGLLVGPALGLPAAVLGYWLVRGLQAGETLAPLVEPVRHSLWASFWAAGVTIAAALPVAALSARHGGRLSRFVEQAVYAAYALPGIVVALALVFLGANFLGPLYQSLPLLVGAYTILFVSQAVGALRTALLQIPPGLEEAARSLGQGPAQTLRRVTVPLLRPGLAAAAALVFLTAMKELPATLILSPFGFKTLAMAVWSAVSEAFFARAAAPALVLILTSSVPIAFLILREEK